MKNLNADKDKPLSMVKSRAGRLLLLGVLGLGLLVLLLASRSATATIWQVTPDGSGNYDNLTAALADYELVQPGDIIHLAPGIYNETPLVVNRTLTIIGQGPPGQIILDGGGVGDVLKIEADNVTLANLTLTGSEARNPYAGVHLRQGDNLTLKDLTLTNNHRGFYLEGGSGARIVNLNVTGNSVGGWLLNTRATVIEKTIFRTNEQVGLKLQGSRETAYEQVTIADQPVNLEYFGVHSHDVAFNSTFDNVIYSDGDGSLVQLNGLALRVANNRQEPLAGVELNLTVDGRQVYATPAYNGSRALSGSDGSFELPLLEFANHTLAGSLYPQIAFEITTPLGWVNGSVLNLSGPLTLLLSQPNLPPEIELTGPADDSLQLPNLTLAWTSFDPEGANLSYRFQYRATGQGQWSEQANLSSTTFNLTNLARGEGYQWRVIADDGNLTVESPIYTFKVNALPTVTLAGPPAGAHYTSGAPTLNWSATDLEEGNLLIYLYLDQNPGPTTLKVSGADLGGLALAELAGVAGNYYWRVEVSDGLERVSSPARNFTVNGLPRATIDSVTPLSAPWPATVTGQGHGADDGTIAAHQWRVAGLGIVSTTSSVTLTNLTNGSHQLEYRVRDDEGLWSEWTHQVVVLWAKPVADAGQDYAGYIGESVFFDGSRSEDPDGRIVLWEWDFDGDGAYEWSDDDSPLSTNIYRSVGQYQAVLRVTDNEGYTATDARIVTIEKAPSNPNGDDEGGFINGPSLAMTAVSLSIVGFALRGKWRFK